MVALLGLKRIVEEGGCGRDQDRKMAGAAGLEPVTSAVTGQRSNQLSYAPAKGSQKVSDTGFLVNGFVWIFSRGGFRLVFGT
jgi:hypothetical protein